MAMEMEMEMEIESRKNHEDQIQDYLNSFHHHNIHHPPTMNKKPSPRVIPN